MKTVPQLNDMKIRSKAEFFRLWEAGVLGNRPPLFRTVEAAIDSGLPRIGFRELGKAGGGAWELVSSPFDVQVVAKKWERAGKKFIMDGSVPNDHSTMQGEVRRGEWGLESYLCVREHIEYQLSQGIPCWIEHLQRWGTATGKCYPGLPPMRETMKRGWHCHRGYLETKVLLDRYLDPSSRDDLDALLELYPDATIELTAFDIDTGVIPGRNTIFWEVRDY